MIITSRLAGAERIVAEEMTAGMRVYVEEDDGAALRRLEEECGKYAPEMNGGRRMECWLIAGDALTLWTLQSIGVPERVREKADVMATTMEDLTAKTVLVRLPGAKAVFPPLDRKPMSLTSEMNVHLVIAGYSSFAEAFAINAALVAHYPNYCRNTDLRTRITIIDNGVLEKSQAFIQRYSHLFNNSYYRTLNLTDPHPECILHRPEHEGKRRDFVDVEWEFVDGDIRDDAVRQKLKEWSSSPRRQLTIALCNEDHGRNVDEALSLPDDVYENGVSVMCNTDDSSLLAYARMEKRYAGVFPFGRDICTLDTMRMLKSLAKRVNYAYNHAFSLKPGDTVSAPTSIDREVMEAQWSGIRTLPKLYSNVFNAMTLGTKMHSLGHDADDWKRYYAMSREEIEILMEVEHNRWSVEELILGYRPVTDEEQVMVELDMAEGMENRQNLKKRFRDEKIHYDLRAFDDLRDDVTGKNVNIYDYVLTQSIPFIIKTCIAE